MAKSAFKAKIYGVVQGVGFRYFTARQAAVYDVTGYVKNLPDGTVETVAEGEKDVLENFLKVLKKGPYGSVVENIDIDWQQPANRHQDFRITY